MAYATPFKTEGFECYSPQPPEDEGQLLEILGSLAIGDFRSAFVTYFTNQLVELGEKDGVDFLSDFNKEVEKAVKDAF